MPFIPYDKFREAGSSSGGFLKDTANAAANFACQLYRDFPGAIVKNDAEGFLHGLWDELCKPPSPPGLPAPPAPPLPGGQCPVYYVFNVCGLAYGTPAPSGSSGSCVVGARPVIGPLSNLRTVETVITGTYNRRTNIYITGGDGKEYQIRQVDTNGSWNKDLIIRREDNKADDCGSLPPIFPPSPPIPPQRLTGIYIATYRDTSKRTMKFTVNQNSFAPTLNIDVNGINFNFHLDGLTINYPKNAGDSNSDIITKINQDIDIGNEIKTIVNDVRTNVTSLSVDVKKVDATIVARSLRDANDPKADSALELKNPLPPGVYVQPRLALVYVNLSTVPTNARRQKGEPGNDIVYSGWFQFRRAGRNLPREPIHHVANTFIAPVGADGFAYHLYTGFTGIAIPVINKEVPGGSTN